MIPLIRQTVWRVPEKEQAKDGGGKPGGKAEEELALDREAAEAIVKGEAYLQYQLLVYDHSFSTGSVAYNAGTLY